MFRISLLIVYKGSLKKALTFSRGQYPMDIWAVSVKPICFDGEKLLGFAVCCVVRNDFEEILM